MDLPTDSAPLPPSGDAPPPMSLVSRMTNLLHSPGEVFDDVRASRPTMANWLVPALILILIGWITSTIVLANPAIKHQIAEMSQKALDKSFADHPVPAQQQEAARKMAANFSEVGIAVAAYAVPPIQAFGLTFVWAFFLWIVGAKICKGGFTYLKAAEVVGLSLLISTVDAVVRALLVLTTGNLFAGPSLMWLVKDFDPQNNAIHGVLASVELFSLWALAVRAVGLSRLARISFAKAATWVFGIWIAYTLGFAALGALFRALMASISKAH